MSILQGFLFPPPPSIFVNVVSATTLLSMANAGIQETRGKHMQYSKFVNFESITKTNKSKSFPSKLGMFLFYAPAFLFSAASFFIFPDEGLRFLLVRLCLTIHYLKRVLEVLFVHRYSGTMTLDALITVPLHYLLSSITTIYSQHLSQDLPEPSTDLKYIGIILFLLGITGNFYHHYKLSTLRGKDEKQYKIPKGGMFDLVVCPHYFFEVLGFFGVAFISQTVYGFSFALATGFYLMGRSFATRRWYMSKFEEFNTDVKAMIPFLL